MNISKTEDIVKEAKLGQKFNKNVVFEKIVFIVIVRILSHFTA